MRAATLASASGLTAVVAPGGALASLTAGDTELIQHAATAFEPGLLQIWLRDRENGNAWPLLGAGSHGAVAADGATLVVTGAESQERDVPGPGGLRWRVTFALHPAALAWAWHVEVFQDGPGERTVDLVHTHDVAVSGTGALRANELYVSQYLDLTPLEGPTGTAVAVRQNLPQAQGRHPWALLTASREVVAWATDALDVHGWAAREGRASSPVGDLPSRRRQHEHTLVALQVAPVTLGAGDVVRVSFAGLLDPDHPTATGPRDVPTVAEALALAEDTVPDDETILAQEPATAPSSPYDADRQVAGRDLTEAEVEVRWPGPWRSVERDERGRLLSLFVGDEHVVMRAKECAVLRPHGTILRSGAIARPDPEALTVTTWMTGSPLSYLTRGHATSGRTLTTVRGYLGLHRAYGLRAFVEVAGRWRLLDLPSAFSMTLDGARWVYAVPPEAGDPGGVVELRTAVPPEAHRVRMTVSCEGGARRVLLALHAATRDEPLPGGTVTWDARPDGVVVHLEDGVRLDVRASVVVAPGDDSRLFDDGEHRSDAVVTLLAAPVDALALDLTVADVAVTDRADPGAASASSRVARWWDDVTAVRVAHEGTSEVDALAVSLPWLVRDAVVHYLSPRGLEQYTGGAWGTRDVTQGPLELLLALDRLEDARWLVRRVFAAQNLDGSWPQAFGFMPGDERFRHEPPHGDVVHWPVLALGRYLQASGDLGVLDEPVGWYVPAGQVSPAAAPLREHMLLAIERARLGYLPGTHLVAYGHGDWNDSLQPADPAMATSMASAWTATLHHQSLRSVVDALEPSGAHDRLVAELTAEAAAIAADLHHFMLVDGELAGYVRLAETVDPGQRPDVAAYLVHPRDTATGLRHGSLQMIHALVGDLLDPGEARAHVGLVRDHLMGADGVRLFDRPPRYRGGEMHHFQRAETATFVGREIGLMYVHAHLRWCEAMARWGDAEALWEGLRQVLPPAALDVVPGAARRQANTYTSSSDAAVLDRAEFSARYADVLSGATGLEAGWRIYSSGPGVLVRILTQSFLGVRRRGDHVELDPVVPARLDGLTAEIPLAGGLLRLRVRGSGAGVAVARMGERVLPSVPTSNPYRRGGVRVRLSDLSPALVPGGPIVEVELA